MGRGGGGGDCLNRRTERYVCTVQMRSVLYVHKRVCVSKLCMCTFYGLSLCHLVPEACPASIFLARKP